MKRICVVLFLLFSSCFTPILFGQKVEKENLSKKTSLFWDFNRTQLQAIGAYYVDETDQTTDRHGKWLFYNRLGELEEERNYFKGMLHGRVLLYHANEKPKQEGYFYLDQQDSIYKEWSEIGKLIVQGTYKRNEPIGKWTYYYPDGREKSEEWVEGKTNKVMAFWLPDSTHTQTVVNGTGELAIYYTNGALKEWYNYLNGDKNGPFEERSIYGYTTLKGFFNAGEKDSTWTYAYYSGDVEKVTNYKNGSLHGDYSYFYDNGQVNVVGRYENGKKYGLWTWYTNKGTKDMEGLFADDLQHGDWKYWHPTGELSYTATYDKGLKSGTWTYYFKDGTKFKEGTFVNDWKDGLWETWYEDGTLLMKGLYKQGKEEGEWQNYWENGNLKNKSYFKQGQLNGQWLSYYPSGKIKLKGKYDMDFKVGEWTDYYENGKPKDVVTYKVRKEKSKVDYGIMKDRIKMDAVKDGMSISYSSKDYNKTEEGNYKNGQKDGQWTAYFPGGKFPAVISTYKDGKLHGPMKQYARRGNLLQEMEYKDGLKHGKFIVYDNKGKVLLEKKFENGQEILEGTATKSKGFTPK